ncbi:chemotaxis protein CheD [Thermospira aquatica]|uniref:Probable chemoreceptor glutamine deamidase CheD n=1 Tax=Thermospira aquatica TaxID=2828656 RepID=A0AAX3BDL8_9SPIR|nr:chemotaxis protein CheD [Thermospira aquatica]URA10367.1 chemotaxis protein CheD [Thermospira aquatica]
MSEKVIGIGEWAISDNPEDKITTYALGSCVALIVYAKKYKIGAMAHIALPSSHIDPARSDNQPAYFADRAVKLILDAFTSRNIPPKELEVKLVGGAQMLDPNGIFDIGRRNVLEIKKLLWQNMLAPRAEDVGGSFSRTVSLFIDDGKTIISSQNKKYEL